MGLYVTYDCFTMSYSTFSAWRVFLAEMTDRPVTFYARSKDICQGIWDEPPADMIDIILEHSDCDGIIQAKYLKPLADRLEDIVKISEKQDKKFEGLDSLEGIPYYSCNNNIRITQQFIAGLQEADIDGKDVEFM